MRYLKLALIVALPLAVATQASAIYLPVGATIEMKFTNWDVGNTYHNLVLDKTYTQAELDALPTTDPGGGAAWQTPAPGAAPGEDGWGIFWLESIKQKGAGITPDGTLYWSAFTDTAYNTKSEITGIFWGITDTFVKQSTGSSSQEIHGTGLYFAFFEDFGQDFTPATPDTGGGPGNRGELWGGGDKTKPYWTLATNDGADAGADGQTGTIDDAKPIWTGVSVPGFKTAYPTDEFFTTFDPSAAPGGFTGAGGFNAEMGAVPVWGAGSLNGMWFDPTGADLFFSFTGTSYDGSTGWMVTSNDPVRGRVTPELPSGALMLIGLVPMGLAFLRRKKED